VAEKEIGALSGIPVMTIWALSPGGICTDIDEVYSFDAVTFSASAWPLGTVAVTVYALVAAEPDWSTTSMVWLKETV